MRFLAALDNKLVVCRLKDTIRVQAYSKKGNRLDRRVCKWTDQIICQCTAIMNE